MKIATSLNVIYWALFFYFFKLVIQIKILVNRQSESPLDAVGLHTTGQTNMKGMHWSKLQVTVECEEDRNYTTLNQ